MITDDSDIVAECSSSTDSLQEYTKDWLSRTDSGGLSHVSNLTFWFFCEVESLEMLCWTNTIGVRNCCLGS